MQDGGLRQFYPSIKEHCDPPQNRKTWGPSGGWLRDYIFNTHSIKNCVSGSAQLFLAGVLQSTDRVWISTLLFYPETLGKLLNPSKVISLFVKYRYYLPLKLAGNKIWNKGPS